MASDPDLRGRLGGTGGASGGLYVRQEVAGTIVVNSSMAALSYTVPSAMLQAQWSGGGSVAADGTEATQSLTYTQVVPAGALSVPAQTAIILRSPSGVPPAGVEPGGGQDAGADSGVGAGADSGVGADSDSGAASGADADAASDSAAAADAASVASAAKPGSSGGCGCRVSSAPRSPTRWAFLSIGATAAACRRRRRATPLPRS